MGPLGLSLGSGCIGFSRQRKVTVEGDLFEVVVDRAENLSTDGCGCIVANAYMTPRSCTSGRYVREPQFWSVLGPDEANIC
jgi:hypothetical protein